MQEKEIFDRSRFQNLPSDDRAIQNREGDESTELNDERVEQLLPEAVDNMLPYEQKAAQDAEDLLEVPLDPAALDEWFLKDPDIFREDAPAESLADASAFSGTSEGLTDPAAFPGTSEIPNDPAAFPGTSEIPNDPAAFSGTSEIPNDPAVFPGTSEIPNDPAAFSGTSEGLTDPGVFPDTLENLTDPAALSDTAEKTVSLPSYDAGMSAAGPSPSPGRPFPHEPSSDRFSAYSRSATAHSSGTAGRPVHKTSIAAIIIKSLTTIAGAAVCLLIVLYFRGHVTGTFPETGLLSTFLKSDPETGNFILTADTPSGETGEAGLSGENLSESGQEVLSGDINQGGEEDNLKEEERDTDPDEDQRGEKEDSDDSGDREKDNEDEEDEDEDKDEDEEEDEDRWNEDEDEEDEDEDRWNEDEDEEDEDEDRWNEDEEEEDERRRDEDEEDENDERRRDEDEDDEDDERRWDEDEDEDEE